MTAPASLHSEQWFRVAALRPQLDAQAHVQRVSYRRQIWHVVTRADTSRSFRLNPPAYAFVARCNGKLTMQRLWDLMLQELRDEAPTQDEILQLLAQLHAAALLSFDRRPDFGAQGRVQDPVAPGAQAANTLLSFRMPFGRPDALLGWLYPHLRWLFCKPVAILWELGVAAAALAALLNLAMLQNIAAMWLQTPRMLMLAWVCYPPVKALHELGHGLAIKHLGAEVPQWGVTVMMFMPVPYVDASAASPYAQRSQRLLVSAAGIMVELWLAAVGLAVALNTQPGWIHDIALAVFFIGSVSTLAVNGNPLLRFDGYHVLCDALALPNLATRSSRYWLQALRAALLRAPAAQPVLPAQGESPWLWCYAPAALVYRVVLAFAVVAWLAGLSFVIGAAVALLFIWSLVLKPLGALARFLAATGLAEGEARQVRRRAAAWGGAALLGVALVPLPFASVVQGVVWLPEQALLRAQTDGFVGQVLVHDGQAVSAGQPLLELHSPLLLAERDGWLARIEALQAERYATLRGDPGRASSIERELHASEAELARSEEKIAQLTVHAQTAGRAVIHHASDLQGRYVKQGALVGQVLTDQPTLVRVAVGQEQAALLHGQTQGISVRLAELGQAVWPAQLVRDATAAVTQLPSAALGDRGGGAIVTDPKDKHGLVAAQNVVLADLRLPLSLGERVGGRAWVRFDHGHASLGEQGARAVQQLVLKHFNPAQ